MSEFNKRLLKLKKNLLEMTKHELEVVISNTFGCLNCSTPISYEVLGSRFCQTCNMRYGDQIRKLIKKHGFMRGAPI